MPFWAVECRNYQQTEAEFFSSANYLCKLYNITLPDVAGLCFPQNVSATYAQVCKELKKKDNTAECIILRDEKHKATLATLKRYDTGQCLYYIPVRPVWRLVQTAEQQPLAEMFLSVFACLYQVAEIPFYRDNSSYLVYEYDMLDQWINEAQDEGDNEEQAYRDEQSADLTELAEAGDQLLKFICRPYWLEQLETHISAYRRWENWDLETECLASAFLQLFKDYPKQSVFDHIRPDLFEPEETDRVRPNQYISFYWSGEDSLYEMLFEMINNEIQECGITDEPMIVQVFDSPQNQPLNDLNFEKRLFELIDQLCKILNPYEYD
jgi:hypothetical protein